MRIPIAFSTLACPDWTRETIVNSAARFGYDGIEWRGGAEGHVQPSMPGAERQSLKRCLADAGLFSLAVTAYTAFVSDDPAERDTNVGDLRRYLDLAAELDARYVRAFLGELRPGAALATAQDSIGRCLEAAAGHAQSVGVGIAVEPHDDFVRSASVAPIFDRVTDPAVGAVWDIGNAFAAGEGPAEGFPLLGQRIFYVQVKDSLGRFPNRRLTRRSEPVGRHRRILDAGHTPAKARDRRRRLRDNGHRLLAFDRMARRRNSAGRSEDSGRGVGGCERTVPGQFYPNGTGEALGKAK